MNEAHHVEPSEKEKLLDNLFFGRVEEKALIRSAVDKMINGQSVVVHVLGAGGSGKSFLVNSVLEDLPGYDSFTGKYDQFLIDVPYQGIKEALGTIIQQRLSLKDDKLDAWQSEFADKFSSKYDEIKAIVPAAIRLLNALDSKKHLHESSSSSKNRINDTLIQLVQFVIDHNDRPIILHLDDIQWSDQSSLSFLSTLMAKNIKDLLIVMSCRRSSESHIADFISDLGACAELITIPLEPLTKNEIKQTFEVYFDIYSLDNFIDHIYSLSLGSPYVLKELLTDLNSAGWLLYEPEMEIWHWTLPIDGARKNELRFTQILESKLLNMSDNNKLILRTSACFGRELNIPFISRVFNFSLKDIEIAFKESIALGFITPLIIYSGDKTSSQNNFKITHDLVHEWLLNSIKKDDRQAIHQKIAHYYTADSSLGLIDKNLFEALYHLNIAITSDSSDKQKRKHAKLNLEAAKKAKRSASYSLALKYINQTSRFNIHNEWEEEYDLVSEIHIEGYQIAKLSKDEKLSKAYFTSGIRHCKKRERTQLRLAKLVLHIQFGELQDAIDIGIEGLRELGVKVPINASKTHVIREIIRTKWILRGKSIEDIYNLPELKNDDIKLAFDIIFWMFRSANYINPDLNGVLALRLFQNTIKHGTDGSAYSGLMAYGVILGAGTNNYTLAYDYCDLGNRIAAKYKNDFGSVHFGRAIYTVFKYPLRSSLPLYDTAKNDCAQIGDFLGATEPTMNESLTYLAAGLPLEVVQNKIHENSQYCSDRLMKDYHEFQELLKMHISKLQNKSIEPEFELAINHILKNTKSYFTLGINAVLTMQEQAYKSDWQALIKTANDAKEYVPFLTGTYSQTEYFFYKAVGLLKNYSNMHILSRIKTKRTVTKIIRNMTKWSKNAPANHKHKLFIIKGLMAQINKQYSKTESLLLSGYDNAKTQEFTQNEALALSFLADHFKTVGNNFKAEEYSSISDQTFKDWGRDMK